MRLGAEEIWIPDIFLYNNAMAKELQCWNSNVVVRSTGEVIWVPPCHLTSYCNATETIESESGIISCMQRFGSWTYDTEMINLEPTEQV